MVTYEEAIALIDEQPNALYYGQFAWDDEPSIEELITLWGPMMKGFLQPGDVFRSFKRF